MTMTGLIASNRNIGHPTACAVDPGAGMANNGASFFGYEVHAARVFDLVGEGAV